MPACSVEINQTDGANRDERWIAVQRRDARADGQFVYSVASTGVYCRPSCPSRLARRENVAFHPDPVAAEAAGFRACLRCTLNGSSQTDRRAEAVAAACRLIESAEELPDLDKLAAAAGMSRFHFHRVFKSVTGVTPKDYARARRAERVRDALGKSVSVTEAIYDAGYNANSRFYEEAGRQLGMRPREYRNGGKGTTIRFAVGQCSTGAILVAATEKGVCAILLGDDPDNLVRDLEDQFPKAELIGADEGFELTMAMVVGFIDSPGKALGLPLDVQGTAFQRQVWEALGKIPAGSKMSYSAIAQAIGCLKAARAVAQACASNTLAVAIPCHRVVRSDGKLSGYRWGVERKRLLLDREAAEKI